ncbi:hypothetical protein AALC16_14185 [Lachnospiraceae bacterium 29-91]|jgi:hypothetical protein|nr:hypothetical protein [uncultured Schaedlerella sp.]EOS38720.1 hypothetical protein C808_02931 [Lachnospiraceae bacterium M18-1]
MGEITKTNTPYEQAMSNRERIVQLLDIIPDYKIGYVLAYVQGIAADEEADDTFCQRMVEDYENDSDPKKDKTYTLEECMKEWGISEKIRNDETIEAMQELENGGWDNSHYGLLSLF